MKKRILLMMCALILILVACGKEKDDGTLSSDWKDMQFTMDDVRYVLPSNMSELEGIIDVDVSENMDVSFGAISDSKVMVAANDAVIMMGCFKGSEATVTITVANDSDTEKPLKDCKLVGLSMKADVSYDKVNSEWSSDAADFAVAGGGRFGLTMEDLLGIYGEPSVNETYENKHGITGNIYYTVEDKNGVTKYLRFSIYKNLINEIELMCEEYL